jgi:hypothetical protein
LHKQSPNLKSMFFVAGWQDENLYRIFLKILNENVRDEVLREERPDTLQRYMKRAIVINRQFFERRMDRRTRNPNSNHRPQPRPNQRGRLSPLERTRRLRKKLCLYCGQAGCENVQQKTKSGSG